MSDLPSFERLIESVDGQGASPAPLDRLRAAADLSRQLSTLADRLLDHYVTIARAAGVSWAEIGGVLGVSKQAAHQRFSQPSSGTQTKAAYAAFATAEAEAIDLSHSYVGTEHILLALTRDDQSIAGVVLTARGIRSTPVAHHIEDIIGTGQTTDAGVPVPRTPRARRLTKLAGKEARRTGCRQVDTGHLLLAMLQQTDSVAARILLERHQVDPGDLRADVLRRVGSER